MQHEIGCGTAVETRGSGARFPTTHPSVVIIRVVAPVIRLIMKIHGDLVWATAQPIRNQGLQQVIPLLLQVRNPGWRQLFGQIAAHGIGIGRALQIDTGRFKRSAARGSS